MPLSSSIVPLLRAPEFLNTPQDPKLEYKEGLAEIDYLRQTDLPFPALVSAIDKRLARTRFVADSSLDVGRAALIANLFDAKLRTCPAEQILAAMIVMKRTPSFAQLGIAEVAARLAAGSLHEPKSNAVQQP